MPEKCPVDTDRAYFCRKMCQQDRQFDIMVRCIKRIMFREFRKESMQRSYILANAKVIFRLVPKLYLLRKLYFDCRQRDILAYAKVAVFILNLPTGQVSLRKQYHCRRQYHCVSIITAEGSSRHRHIAS